MNRNRCVFILAFAAVVAGLMVIGAYQRWMSGAWHSEEVTVLLPPGLTTSELIDTLSKQLPKGGSRVVDHLTMRDWNTRLKPGRYTFPAQETVKQSATRLVTGQREPVKVVIPSGRDVGPVAGATARRIFADSNDVAKLFLQDSMRWRIVPNTYEMWWETDVHGLADRILREHEVWWTEDRRAAARAL